MPSNTSIEGFSHLTSTISLYRPPAPITTQNASSDKSPSLVVLCSWMGAAPKYIAKYTQGYQSHFPNASILLVQCPAAEVFQSDATAERKLAPACEVILNAHKQNSNRRIALHAFSNGGGTQTTHLARSLRAQLGGKSAALPFSAHILDCHPGKPRIAEAVLAFTISMPSPWKILAAALLHVVFFLYMLSVKVFRVEDGLSRLRRRLNEPALFDVDVPRLYLYTMADRLVRSDDIREHAAKAKENGFQDVREEVFVKSPHCALPTEDAQRYWKLVTEHLTGTKI